MRIFGVALDCVQQNLLCFIEALQVEQGDSTIELGDVLIRIERGRCFEGFQSFFKELLVHVSRAEIVETRGFRGLVGEICRSRFLWRSGEESER